MCAQSGAWWWILLVGKGNISLTTLCSLLSAWHLLVRGYLGLHNNYTWHCSYRVVVRATTVPVVVTSLIQCHWAEADRDVSLSDLCTQAATEKYMGTRNSPSIPKDILTWNAHLLHNLSCALCTTFFTKHTSNIYTKKAPGRKRLRSIFVCYI